mgnify:CR=1 FL=1
MSNPLFETFDTASLEHDIGERQEIIEKYQMTGLLDRDDAISKIRKLRCTDKEIAEETVVRLAVSSIPFEYCSNDILIGELQMQKTILEGKLLAKRREDIHHADT